MEVSKASNSATETTDVAVGDTVKYIDGNNGMYFDVTVLGVSGEGRVVDISHPDPKQPRRNGVQHSDDGVWHTWHFKPADEAPMPAPEGMVQENAPLSDEYTKPAAPQSAFDPFTTTTVS